MPKRTLWFIREVSSPAPSRYFSSLLISAPSAGRSAHCLVLVLVPSVCHENSSVAWTQRPLFPVMVGTETLPSTHHHQSPHPRDGFIKIHLTPLGASGGGEQRQAGLAGGLGTYPTPLGVCSRPGVWGHRLFPLAILVSSIKNIPDNSELHV